MTEKEFTPSKHGVYFLELELENVRCFGEPVKIELWDPKDKTRPARWTVLVGENGVGKTTVLRSLFILKRHIHNCLFKKRAKSLEIFSTEYVHQSYGWNVGRVGVEATISGRIAESEAISGHFKKLGSDFNIRFFPLSEEGVDYQGNKHLAFRQAELSFEVIGYGASRQMSMKSIEDNSLGNMSTSLFQDNVELTNTSELFHQTYISATKLKDSRLHDTIKAIILSVLPGIKNIRTAPTTGLTWRAEVETPYGWVWIHDLSLGYKTMVSWIVDFAMKLFLLYPNSPNPLAEPAVCLVDEIDLHMHPTWQRKIMGFLTEKFPNTQFIVTAHSPLMVQASADANIVLLKREGDHVVVDNDPIVVKNWSVDQILSSVFGVSGRMEETEIAAARRRNLQSKASLTSEEHEELLGLDTQLRGYSVYETAEQREAVSLLDTFTKIIKESNATKPDDQHP